LRSETSFLWALLRTGRQHALGLLFAAASFVGAAACSLFVATVPGERLDGVDLFVVARQQNIGGSLLGQALPALGSVFGAQDAVFPRNLVVTDLDLAAANAAVAGRVSINLRGRDLRGAKFDRSHLRGADLSGANLEAASLTDADLSNVLMPCLAPDGDRPGAQCTRARNANLARAKLSAARLSGIDLAEASLEGARLEDAQLDGAVLTGANLSGAHLERANLAGGVLRQARLSGASLQGADLSGAQLQLADLSEARAQGADLSMVSFEGARLRNAELEGANLSRSLLAGADLAGAKLAGADLTAAMVWRTVPPSDEGLVLADTSGIALRPPRDQELARLGVNARSDEARLAVRLSEDPGRSGSASEVRAWAASAEQQAWQDLLKPREATDADQYKSRLTGYLIRLMCQSRWADGAVAAGIAKRAMAPGFKGDLAAIHARLRSADCSASHRISRRLMHALDVAVEVGSAQD
ncbi:MAG TPA: pentapeptide repeat-containing protein, partial [Hyphomicrobiaceae bacterium]|nr:pentapeptide repeat-containing protein [Hyphomicrobiaceae bacterium]